MQFNYNSATFWATDSTFSMEVWMNCPNKLWLKISNFIISKNMKNNIILNIFMFFEFFMVLTKSTKWNTLLNLKFWLQTPDFAWKFVWIVQINYKSTKVQKVQKKVHKYKSTHNSVIFCTVQPNMKVQKVQKYKIEKYKNKKGTQKSLDTAIAFVQYFFITIFGGNLSQNVISN